MFSYFSFEKLQNKKVKANFCECLRCDKTVASEMSKIHLFTAIVLSRYVSSWMREDTLNKHDVKVSKTCRQLTKRNALKLLPPPDLLSKVSSSGLRGKYNCGTQEIKQRPDVISSESCRCKLHIISITPLLSAKPCKVGRWVTRNPLAVQP